MFTKSFIILMNVNIYAKSVEYTRNNIHALCQMSGRGHHHRQNVVLGSGPPTMQYPNPVHQGMLYIDEATGTLYVFWHCNWIQITNPGSFSFNIEVRETAGGPAIHGPMTVQNGGTIAFYGVGNTIDFSLTPGSVIVGQSAISVTFGAGVPATDGIKTGDVYFDTTNNNVYRWNSLGAWVLVYSLPSGGATGPTGPAGPTGPTGTLSQANIFVSQSDDTNTVISTNLASPTQLFSAGTIDVVVDNNVTFLGGNFTIVTSGTYLVSTTTHVISSANATVSTIAGILDGITLTLQPSSQATVRITSADYVAPISHTFQVAMVAGQVLQFFALSSGDASLVADTEGVFAQSQSQATVSIALLSTS